MYACGVTVYDYCHIGHARSAMVFDVIRNYLTYKGYYVLFVKNFTDVDDKIIARANEERLEAGLGFPAVRQVIRDLKVDHQGRIWEGPLSPPPRSPQP